MAGLSARIKQAVLGRTASHCAWGECQRPIAEGEGYRVLPMQVYCNEEHALQDQRNPAL